MRNKWHNILKNRCSTINWNRSKICSKHFDNKYFDSQRNLKENAIPTMFPSSKLMVNVSTCVLSFNVNIFSQTIFIALV